MSASFAYEEAQEVVAMEGYRLLGQGLSFLLKRG